MIKKEVHREIRTLKINYKVASGALKKHTLLVPSR